MATVYAGTEAQEDWKKVGYIDESEDESKMISEASSLVEKRFEKTNICVNMCFLVKKGTKPHNKEPDDDDGDHIFVLLEDKKNNIFKQE